MNTPALLAYLRDWLAHYPEDVFIPLAPATAKTTPDVLVLRQAAAVDMARHVLRRIIADVESGHERLTGEDHDPGSAPVPSGPDCTLHTRMCVWLRERETSLARAPAYSKTSMARDVCPGWLSPDEAYAACAAAAKHHGGWPCGACCGSGDAPFPNGTCQVCEEHPGREQTDGPTRSAAAGWDKARVVNAILAWFLPSVDLGSREGLLAGCTRAPDTIGTTPAPSAPDCMNAAQALHTLTNILTTHPVGYVPPFVVTVDKLRDSARRLLGTIPQDIDAAAFVAALNDPLASPADANPPQTYTQGYTAALEVVIAKLRGFRTTQVMVEALQEESKTRQDTRDELRKALDDLDAEETE